MPLDVKALLERHQGRNYELHAQHVNPMFARVLRTIGYDRCYVRAEGPYLWDDAGTRYLDLLAGYGVFNLGRNHPDVRAALTDFMACDYPSLVQMEAPLLSGLLAEELKKRMPNELDVVYFTSSGAEGVETAIKFARRATRRPVILHLAKAFHGLTNGSLALNGDDVFRDGFEPLDEHCRKVPLGDLAALEQALAARDVAAFVVEPVQGKGVNIPPPGYLREAAQLCRAHGTLFVADEVQTGMGRTGKFLALEHDGDVDPDIVILSKSLSGGYVPVGAVLTRRSVYDRVFSSMERAVVHSSTFGQGSLAMVAGLATLAVMDESRLVERAATMGERIGRALKEMQARYEFIGDVRWRGLMIGIEFERPRSLGLRTAWSVTHKMDASLFPQAVTMPLLDDHHVLTQVAGHHIDVVKLLPPLVIGDEDVQWFLGAFDRVMHNLHRFPGPVWEALSKIGKNAIKERPRTAAAG
ncbi:MAG: aspartate aminotransferase family protein [Gammaproteobacteria bacterium]